MKRIDETWKSDYFRAPDNIEEYENDTLEINFNAVTIALNVYSELFKESIIYA